MEKARFSDASRGMKPSNTYKPRALRWLNGKQAASKSLVKAIDKEGGVLLFCPYSYTLRGVNKAQLFEEQGGEINLVPREVGEVPDLAGNHGAYSAP